MKRTVSLIVLLYFGAAASAHNSGQPRSILCEGHINFMKREAIVDLGYPGGDMAQWSAAEIEQYYRAGVAPEPTNAAVAGEELTFPGGFRPNWPPNSADIP